MPVKPLLISMFLLHIFLLQQVAAQNKKADYKNKIATIEQNIRGYFYDSTTNNYKEFNKHAAGENDYCYLWPLCGLIQAANEAEAMQMAPPKYLKSVIKTIYHYNDGSAPAAGYASYVKNKASRFYDDNQWIGIASMDAYERTKDASYLFEGRKIYTFMMTGYDTISGGGLYWKEDEKTSKNTCSNGPGIILSLQLYKATKQKKYLDTALLLYNWANKYLKADTYVYYDNIHIPSLKIDKATYTYNTATMLQSNVLLYEITRQQKYLTEAKLIAAAGFGHFYKNSRWPGNYWFNAVLLRAYIHLYKYDKERKYIDAFIADADAIWQTEKDAQNIIGKNDKKQLIDQAAMLEIYCRLLPFVK